MRLSRATSWHADASARIVVLVFAASSVGLALLAHGEARGQPADATETPQGARPRVLIAAPPSGAGDLVSLLQAEIGALGIDVIIESGGRTPEKVDAILRVDGRARTVRVWTSSSTRIRSYAVDPRVAGGDESLAHQVAEVLRAELIVAPKPQPPAPKSAAMNPSLSSAPAAPKPALAPAPQRAPRPAASLIRPRPTVTAATPPSSRAEGRELGSVAIAPTMTLSPGPLAVLGHMGLDARVYVWRGLRLNALALFPLALHHTADPRGEVVTHTGMVGAGAGYDLLGGEPIQLVPSIGAAWQWLHMSGRAAAPYRSDADAADVAYLFLGVDGAYRIISWLSLVAGARVGVIAPAPRLVIAGEDLGAHGQPAVQLFAGAAVPIVEDDL